MLRKASSVAVHHVSFEVRVLQQDMCQAEASEFLKARAGESELAGRKECMMQLESARERIACALFSFYSSGSILLRADSVPVPCFDFADFARSCDSAPSADFDCGFARYDFAQSWLSLP
jgi:hypothetical protein